MVSEACAARRPVYVTQPTACRRRFRAFHERLLAQRRTRAWPEDGVLEPPGLWQLLPARGSLGGAHGGADGGGRAADPDSADPDSADAQPSDSLSPRSDAARDGHADDTARAAARVVELLGVRGLM